MTDLVPLREKLQGKRLLIFDFDGTVADTTPLHAAAFSKVLAPFGIVVDYPQIAGMRTLDAMRQCFSVAGQSMNDAALEALVAAKQQCVRQMISLGLLPLPGVDAFLHWARPRYQLAMVTSGSRGTVSLALEKLGFTDWFDPLICADDLTRSKPDPEGFIKALHITETPREKAIIFEDSESGFSAAHAAGILYLDVRKLDWHLLKNLGD